MKKKTGWFSGIIIIAANAGGTWPPPGDITTTMLGIGKYIMASNIMINARHSSVSCTGAHCQLSFQGANNINNVSS